MKHRIVLLALLVSWSTINAAVLEPLRVSRNGHFLVTGENTPVFLLADIAWWVLTQLKREEITSYPEHRQKQGFNAVAFVAYTEVTAVEKVVVKADVEFRPPSSGENNDRVLVLAGSPWPNTKTIRKN